MLADARDSVTPGCRELVADLERAAARSTVAEITAAVQEILAEFASDGRIELSEELCRPSAESYARRLLYRSEEPCFTVLAMVWAPGQGTPVHDHSGMWCVEGVVEGRIEVTQYDLVERDGERCRFATQETVEAGVGSSGRLIPPFDHHTIHNPSDQKDAITIHVYGGDMERCKIFEPLGEDWYRETERQLSYTD